MRYHGELLGVQRVDFEQIFCMDGGLLRGGWHLKPTSPVDDPFAILKGMEQPSGPLEFKHVTGAKPTDVITTEYVPLRLISSRMVHLLQREGITGWSTFPVAVTGKKGESVPEYHGLVVTGRCGPIQNELSKPVLLEPRYAGGPPRQARMGLYFDAQTWDGSDLFTAEGVGYIFAVERVKHVIERAKVTNVVFKPLTEVQNVL